MKTPIQIGKNIVGSVDGKKLTLEIDLSKTFGDSKSGKTTIVASTNGNKNIPGTEVTLGLNAYVGK